MDPRAEFRSAISAAGLTPPDEILNGGQIRRFSSNGKRGDDSGWYVFHDDGIAAGAFGDWRTGVNETWRSDIGRQLTDEERRRLAIKADEDRRARDAEEARRHAEACAEAQRLWGAAEPAPADHRYLAAKEVMPYGIRHDRRGRLVIPMRDTAGELHSIQTIDGDGGKLFLSGGRVSGCYFGIGKPSGVLLICEGFATGASLHAATGRAVAVGFNAGNLLQVANALRAKYPELAIVICADDDRATVGNPGLSKAIAAAQAIGGKVAIPDFGESRPDGASDFNDLSRHISKDAVRRCVETAMDPSDGRIQPSTPEVSQFSQLSQSQIRENDTWSAPLPLDHEAANGEPFPIDALPGTIGDAVREYQAYGQQPVSLVASSALAVVSLAVQGLADVARDDRLRGPLSLSFLVAAESGERKTGADKAMGAALSAWERECADSMRDEIRRNKAELDAWEQEHEGLKAQLRTAVRKKPVEAANLRQELVEHALSRPREIAAPRLRYEDTNPQALAFSLATGHPSAALWSDEGGMVTGSHGMGKDSLLGFLAALNRLWDGGEIHHDRKQAQSVHVEGRRLTVSLMVQPAVLRELVVRSSGLTRGIGFLARYLVTAPASTMGTRLYRDAPEGMPSLSAFSARITALLSMGLPVDDQGRLAPPLLRLSPEAFEVWREYHDQIEHELRPLGDFSAVKDFAAKSAENATRIAGCLHLFQGQHGTINAATMQSGANLARWYLGEALRLMDLLDEPQSKADARLLDAWLEEAGSCPAWKVLHSGPNQIRDKARRNAAIDVLESLGRARIERDGRREILVRNPALSQTAIARTARTARNQESQDPTLATLATLATAECTNQVGHADLTSSVEVF